MSLIEYEIKNPKKQLEFYKQLSEQLQQELNNLKQIEEEHRILNGELREENKKLEEKYNNALELLLEYNLPCEIDGFMDKNVDYCSKNCGVDDKVFKKCWDKYIEGIIYKK